MPKYTESFYALLEQIQEKLSVLPNSREKSLIITKIDEARLWFSELKAKEEEPQK
jgi:hypothetical protein